MNLQNIKNALQTMTSLTFVLPNGTQVPSHFHVTEVGEVSKKFIDCGGTVREEKTINFQLWEAEDYDHRLAPAKLLSIIELSERILGLDSLKEVNVEYQGETIGIYRVELNANNNFQLVNQRTACLAEDQCGIVPSKPKLKLSEIATNKNTCTPGGGCC